MLRVLTIYILLAAGANGAGVHAAEIDRPAVEALRSGSMEKLIFSDPVPAAEAAFSTRDGTEVRLADFQGQWVVLNFWATWCAPCRKEMPGLRDLAAAFAPQGLVLLPVATGRNPEPAIDRFLADEGLTDLTVYLDPKSALARQSAVLGLPMTLILDPQGREVARLIGDADWGGDSAHAIVGALLATP